MELHVKISTEDAHQLGLGAAVSIAIPLDFIYVQVGNKEKRVKVEAANSAWSSIEKRRALFVTLKEVQFDSESAAPVPETT